jgi:hypothetical protein
MCRSTSSCEGQRVIAEFADAIFPDFSHAAWRNRRAGLLLVAKAGSHPAGSPHPGMVVRHKLKFARDLVQPAAASWYQSRARRMQCRTTEYFPCGVTWPKQREQVEPSSPNVICEGTLRFHDKSPICPVANGLFAYWQRAVVYFQLALCPETEGHDGVAN